IKIPRLIGSSQMNKLGLNLKDFIRHIRVNMTLVYFEQTNDVNSAIEREKQLKNWHRQWKINLIEKENPEWEDLYDKII
ncbi:MAG: nuclease family protein, partial [Ignavibacteria bacterium]|nr:nuclease family protein [Ignavibacteria bacterium]